MAENIAKIILDLLTVYDVKHVTQKHLQKVMDCKQVCLGAWTKEPSNIYILKGHTDMLTYLHEFGHAYLDKLGVEISEEETDRLAQDWKRVIDGVYVKRDY